MARRFLEEEGHRRFLELINKLRLAFKMVGPGPVGASWFHLLLFHPLVLLFLRPVLKNFDSYLHEVAIRRETIQRGENEKIFPQRRGVMDDVTWRWHHDKMAAAVDCAPSHSIAFHILFSRFPPSTFIYFLLLLLLFLLLLLLLLSLIIIIIMMTIFFLYFPTALCVVCWVSRPIGINIERCRLGNAGEPPAGAAMGRPAIFSTKFQ